MQISYKNESFSKAMTENRRLEWGKKKLGSHEITAKYLVNVISAIVFKIL